MNTKNAQKSTVSKKSENVKKDYSTIHPLVKTTLFGIGLTNATTKEVLEYILKIVQKTKKNIYVVTPNPEILLFAKTHEDLKIAINTADLALVDGMQLYRTARFVGKPLKERIIGTDFMEKVCEMVEDWPITVGFLGAGPGVAEKTAECLVAKFPRLKVAFVGEEWDQEGFANAQKYHVLRSMYYGKNKKKDSLSIHNTKYIIPNTVDILFVAFGFPKQEQWMHEHINKIPVRVMIGVGGAFDQIVHPSLRPPKVLHSIGLGWLYRLIREPWRIKRQIQLVKFLRLVMQEKLS